jgi:lactoylglutathione lyase/glyoxylase I family protein
MVWPLEQEKDRFQTPRKKPRLTLAGWRGHHVGVRVKDLNEAKKWYVEKLDFRVVLEWPYADEQLAYIALPNDDAFLVELLGGGNPLPIDAPKYSDLGDSLRRAAITTSASTCRMSRKQSPISELAVSRS